MSLLAPVPPSERRADLSDNPGVAKPRLVPRTPPESFVTPEEAAAFLRCSPITVKRLAREGKIPAHSITNGTRKRWRFLLSELANRMQCEVSLTPSSAPLAKGESGK